jgi:hypothetical protein
MHDLASFVEIGFSAKPPRPQRTFANIGVQRGFSIGHENSAETNEFSQSDHFKRFDACGARFLFGRLLRLCGHGHRTHRTVPGPLNFHQAVTRWMIER